MSNHHNDSQSEQGGYQEISFSTGESLEVEGGTTNVLLHTSAASGNVDVGGLLTHEHSGRKLRFVVRDDVNGSATIRFLESAGNFITVGSIVELKTNDSIEFSCVQTSAGVLNWIQIGQTNIT